MVKYTHDKSTLAVKIYVAAIFSYFLYPLHNRPNALRIALLIKR